MTDKQGKFEFTIRTGTIIKVVTVAWLTYGFFRIIDDAIEKVVQKQLGVLPSDQEDSWAEATKEAS